MREVRSYVEYLAQYTGGDGHDPKPERAPNLRERLQQKGAKQVSIPPSSLPLWLAQESVLFDEQPDSDTEDYKTEQQIKVEGRKQRTTENLEEYFFQLQEDLNTIISPFEIQLISFIQSGMTNQQIAAECDRSKKAIEEKSSRLRKRIEEECLAPDNIRRVTSFNDLSLVSAASTRRLPAYKFLRIWYSTEKIVEQHKRNRRGHISEAVRALDFVKAHEVLSEKEYRVLLKNPRYRKLVVIVNRTALIQEKDIARFRSMRTPPGPEYKPLSSFASDERDLVRLRGAINRGRIASVKIDGKSFVRREDIDAYNASAKRKMASE